MDTPKGLEYLCKDSTVIHCVETHTTGEPTRIVYKGYPRLEGTLLEQRAQAQNQYDHIRRQLMWEPRGHIEMYGAILCRDTELTRSGEAHIGVLFTTNEGYSTMCGHATIALGRFLVDTEDLDVFPRRNQLSVDRESITVQVNLHAPCGLVKITVPVLENSSRADTSRPVSFICVPSFATLIDEHLKLPQPHRWPELGDKSSVRINLSYGGAFFCIVDAAELGFSFDAGDASSTLDKLIYVLPNMEHATRKLKTAVNQNLQEFLTHPQHDDLSFLYSTIVVIPCNLHNGDSDEELGVCFFGDQQLDRSPTGSGVAARVALATKVGRLLPGKKRTYHSVLSFRERINGDTLRSGGFIAQATEKVQIPNRSGPDIDAVSVKVEGYAHYTGFHTFVTEKGDELGRKGFLLETSGKLL